MFTDPFDKQLLSAYHVPGTVQKGKKGAGLSLSSCTEDVRP